MPIPARSWTIATTMMPKPTRANGPKPSQTEPTAIQGSAERRPVMPAAGEELDDRDHHDAQADKGQWAQAEPDRADGDPGERGEQDDDAGDLREARDRTLRRGCGRPTRGGAG